jgi:hypothetical protein
MIASFSDYLPLADLVKIVVVCLVVAVIAPVAVALGVRGLDIRAAVRQERAAKTTGTALIAVAVAILAALIGAGLYALFTD